MIEQTTIEQAIECDACQAEFNLTWVDLGRNWESLYCPFCGDKVNASGTDATSRPH